MIDWGRAQIQLGKVTGYLLSETHSEGRGKAKFFKAAGYDPARPSELVEDLRMLAASHPVLETERTPFGTKYKVRGTMTSPLGTTIRLMTVWIIESGRDAPRLVTAYPA